MRKAAITAGLVLIVLAAIVVFKTFPVRSASPGAQNTQNAERAAASLESKINTIKKADADKKRRERARMDITEAELESYVMVYLRKDIPIQIESVRAHLTPGVVAADTRLTIPAGTTGNTLVDALVTGTHNLLISGKLTAAKGEGKFDLQSLSVDGIPVPSILIDACYESTQAEIPGCGSQGAIRPAMGNSKHRHRSGQGDGDVLRAVCRGGL
jgi:hypothetical protein